MENIQLDSTQHRNLNFLKFFIFFLMVLWGAHTFLAEPTPDLAGKKENSIKSHSEDTQKCNANTLPSKKTSKAI
jgi:hypothetical protein